MAETHPGMLNMRWRINLGFERELMIKQHYQSSEWPDPELVSVLVQNGKSTHERKGKS
jgi:hypothetical protein